MISGFGAVILMFWVSMIIACIIGAIIDGVKIWKHKKRENDMWYRGK